MAIGEGDDLPLGRLEAGDVEVAGEDPVAPAFAGAREREVERLQGLDLEDPVTGRRRDVRVVELELAEGRLEDSREDALRVRKAEWRQLGERPPAGGDD